MTPFWQTVRDRLVESLKARDIEILREGLIGPPKLAQFAHPTATLYDSRIAIIDWTLRGNGRDDLTHRLLSELASEAYDYALNEYENGIKKT